jgi:hypothetical protein
MREIKFRAWDKREGKMWIPIIDQDGIPCAKNPISCHLVRMDGELLDPIMQYTGLKDKNGKEIYEGDVGKCGYFGIGFVRYHKGYWEFGFKEGDEVLFCCLPEISDFEVIGNIYQNPELLEE